jgi:hypothetical protein
MLVEVRFEQMETDDRRAQALFYDPLPLPITSRYQSTVIPTA